MGLAGFEVKETRDGYIVSWNGKNYPVADKQLTSPKAFLAAIGCQVMLDLYNSNKPDKNRAVLYHNAAEAGITWPDEKAK